MNPAPALARLLPLAAAALLAGCVLYRPSSNDPRELATIHPVPFPVAPSHRFFGYSSPSGEVVVPSVQSVDGAIRLENTVKACPFHVDAGHRRLYVNGHIAWENNRSEFTCSFLAKLEVELLGGRHYEIRAAMVGPDITHGVEVWMEELGSGAIVHPRVYAPTDTRLYEPPEPPEPRKEK